MKPLPAHKINRKMDPEKVVPGSMTLAASALASRPKTSRVYGLKNTKTGCILYVQFKLGTKQITGEVWAVSPPSLTGYVLWSIAEKEKSQMTESADGQLPSFLATFANGLCTQIPPGPACPGEIEFWVIGK